MKKLVAVVVLAGLLSCERSLVPDAPVSNDNNVNVQSMPYEDQVGKMIYNHIRLHSDVDPYSYASPDQVASLIAM